MLLRRLHYEDFIKRHFIFFLNFGLYKTTAHAY